jgi:site-specific DNA-methyltransferase (adenine-specific)
MDIESITNQIINADCMDILKELPDKCIDLLLTDVPYGINFQSNYRQIKHKKIDNDNNLDWLPEWCSQIARVIKDNAHLYIFCSWHNVDIFKYEIEKYIKVKNILIWAKNNTGMGDLFNDYAPQYEMIIYCNPNNKPLNYGRDSNILRFNRTNNENHPTEKPIDLMTYLISKSSIEGDLVLDTFAGSCPVAIACHNLKRRFICIEKDKDYFDASVERLKNAQAQMKLF